MIPDQECCDCQSPPSSGCEQSPHQSNNHSLDVVLVLAQGDDPGVTALVIRAPPHLGVSRAPIRAITTHLMWCSSSRRVMTQVSPPLVLRWPLALCVMTFDISGRDITQRQF